MKTGLLLFVAGLWVVMQASKGNAIDRLGWGATNTTVTTTTTAGGGDVTLVAPPIITPAN